MPFKLTPHLTSHTQRDAGETGLNTTLTSFRWEEAKRAKRVFALCAVTRPILGFYALLVFHADARLAARRLIVFVPVPRRNASQIETHTVGTSEPEVPHLPQPWGQDPKEETPLRSLFAARLFNLCLDTTAALLAPSCLPRPMLSEPTGTTSFLLMSLHMNYANIPG